jgi:type IX secretion system PorP/SprF family membrane protein
MKKYVLHIILFFCLMQHSHSQDDGIVSFSIPVRNSLKFNRYAINPTFSFVREQNKYVSFTNKRQWVQFNDAPQTYLFSYSGRFRENTGIGIGLFQQNHGVLKTFGGIVNYAYNAVINRYSNLTFGLNLGVYKSSINEGNVITNFPDPSLENIPSNTLITINPGINYGTEFFDLGLSINNAVLYNLKTSKIVEEDLEQGVQAHVMYTGYMNNRGFFDESKFSTLVKSEFKKDKTIISGIMMLTVPKGIWAQAGYNSLYGVSGGIGLNISTQISMEYNYEKAMGNQSNFGSSHEITLAYKFKNRYRYDYSGDDEEDAFLISEKKSKRVVSKRRSSNKTKTTVKPKVDLEAREKLAAERAQSRAEAAKKRKLAVENKAKVVEVARLKLAEEAKAKLAVKEAKVELGEEAKARLVAEEVKGKAEAATRIRMAREAQVKADAEAKARLEAEEAKAKTEADARIRLAREAQEKTDAETKVKLVAEEAKAKAEETTRIQLTREVQEKADAETKARLEAEEAKAKAEEATRIRLVAEAQIKADAEVKARLEAEEAKTKAEADARIRLGAETKAKADADAKARLEAEEVKAKAEEASRIRLESEAQAKLAEKDAEAKAEEEARLKIEQETAAIEAMATIDDAAKSMYNLTKLAEDSKIEQQQLLTKLSETVASKEQDLKDLKEENDLSEKGIFKAPKAFKSVSAENRALESLKLEIDDVLKTQDLKIKELENLYKERLKKNKSKNDATNMLYLRKINELKSEQTETAASKENLVSTLEDIKVATEIERKRRIKRAAYDNEADKYRKDRATLDQIKKYTPESTSPLKTSEFDFGEEQSENIQIMKDITNVESGYYLVLAVHSDIAKRDDFLTKTVAAGQADINFFYDVNTSKYYIYYEKFDNIDQAQNRLQSKGNKPYNGKMSMVKIEN